ncbi:MAG TPA: type IV pilin [Candidatus Thermoplasmatota archaeon]|nr:type IV pilin [Candidatus Thermoplasmatota archaeon]
MKRNPIRTLKRNDRGISPVIGTILMVAATVIIAGAVYAAVNAYNGKAAKPAPDAAFKAQAVDSNNNGLEDLIKITYLSGPPGSNVDVIVTTSTGTALTLTSDPEAGTPPGTWEPGEFATYDGSAATYFVTVRMGDSTLLDQTITLKE